MRFQIVRLSIACGMTFGLIFWGSCFFNKPDDCKEFHSLSLSEQKEKVKKNSIETNFALIRCARFIEGGPSPIADEPIIEGGQASVPFLLSKLDSKDENEQETAILLLSYIDMREGLQNREQVISKIEKTVDLMKNEIGKKYSLKSLGDMKNKKNLE
jgi:hypothetical protein